MGVGLRAPGGAVVPVDTFSLDQGGRGVVSLPAACVCACLCPCVCVCVCLCVCA